jgi:5-methylcytosine-specific restriction endonuclease McrA
VTGLMFGKPEPLAKARARKRRKAHSQRASARALVMDEHTRCVGQCGRLATHMHHVVFLSRGGKDEPSNLAPVCAWCHSDIHAYLATVQRVGVVWTVKRIGRSAEKR